MRKINFFKNFKLSKKYWALALGAVSILTIGTTCTILSSCNEETNIERAINKKVSEHINNIRDSITEVKDEFTFNTNGQEDKIKKDEDSGIEFKAAILKEEYRSYANKRSEEGASNKQICKEIKSLNLDMYEGLTTSYDYLEVFVERKIDEKKAEDCNNKFGDEAQLIEAKYDKIKNKQLEAIGIAKALDISIESKEFSQLFTSVYNTLTSDSLNEADANEEFINAMETILLNNIEDKLDFSNLQNILMSSSAGIDVYTSIKNYLDAYYDPSKMHQEMFCDATRNDDTIKTAIRGLFSNINYVTLNDPEDPKDGSTPTPISYLADSDENPINMLLDSLDGVITDADSSWANHFQFGIKFVLNANEDWDSTKPFGFSNFDFDQDTWKATVKFDLYVDYSESGNFTGNSTGDHDEYEKKYGDDQNQEGNFESSYYLNIGDAIESDMLQYFGDNNDYNAPGANPNQINIIPAPGYDNPESELTIQDFAKEFTQTDLSTNQKVIKPEYCDPNNLLTGTQLSPLISFIKGNDVGCQQLKEDIDAQDKNSYGALDDMWDFTYDPNSIDAGHREVTSNIIVKGNIASFVPNLIGSELTWTIHLNLWVSIPAVLNRSEVEDYDSTNDWIKLPATKSVITLEDDDNVKEQRQNFVDATLKFEEYYTKFFSIFNEKTLSKMNSLKGIMLANSICQTAAAAIALTYAIIYTIQLVLVVGDVFSIAGLIAAWIIFVSCTAAAVFCYLQYFSFIPKCEQIDTTTTQLIQAFLELNFSGIKYGSFDFTKDNNYEEFVKDAINNINGMKSLFNNAFVDNEIVTIVTRAVTLFNSLLITVSAICGIAETFIQIFIGFSAFFGNSIKMLFQNLFFDLGLSSWATPAAAIVLSVVINVNLAIIALTIVTWIFSSQLENDFKEWENYTATNENNN